MFKTNSSPSKGCFLPFEGDEFIDFDCCPVKMEILSHFSGQKLEEKGAYALEELPA